LGREFSDYWSELLTGFEFYCPWEDKKIKYGAGQPQGAYTSWTTFALCHHLVVRVAAHNVLKTFDFDSYFLLGDDIVIWGDERVAKEYLRLITKVLGVEISLEKSLISQNSFEFAKRFFYQGIEVSPLPWTQAVPKGRHLCLSGLLAETEIRGHEFPPVTGNLVYDYLRALAERPAAVKDVYLGYLATTLGVGNLKVPAPKELRRFGLPHHPCVGNYGDVLKDMRKWWVFTRLRNLEDVLGREWMQVHFHLRTLAQSVEKVTEVTFLAVPYIRVLDRTLKTVQLWTTSAFLERMGQDVDYESLLIDVEDLVSTKPLRFTRRMDRIRTISTSAFARAKSYDNDRTTRLSMRK